MALRNVDTRKRRPYRPCVQISRGLAFIFHLTLSGQNGEGKTPCRLRLQGLNLLTLYQCGTFLLRIQSQNSHIPTVVSCRYIDHRWHISLCGMRRNMSLLHLRVSSLVLLSPDDRLEIGLTWRRLCTLERGTLYHLKEREQITKGQHRDRTGVVVVSVSDPSLPSHRFKSRCSTLWSALSWAGIALTS